MAKHHLGGLNRLGHHGTPSATKHGLGGIKSHAIENAHPKPPKSGLKSVRHAGVVKIPRIHIPRPGKGTHNYIKKV